MRWWSAERPRVGERTYFTFAELRQVWRGGQHLERAGRPWLMLVANRAAGDCSRCYAMREGDVHILYAAPDGPMFRIIDGVDISCPRDRAAVFEGSSSDIVGGEAYWQGPSGFSWYKTKETFHGVLDSTS